MEIRKYLNRDQFESSKRRQGDYDHHQQGPPPPYMPPHYYGSHQGNVRPHHMVAPEFDRDRVMIPLHERLFGLSDEERTRELLQMDDEYFM